jgi:hypothetical protein
MSQVPHCLHVRQTTQVFLLALQWAWSDQLGVGIATKRAILLIMLPGVRARDIEASRPFSWVHTAPPSLSRFLKVLAPFRGVKQLDLADESVLLLIEPCKADLSSIVIYLAAQTGLGGRWVPWHVRLPRRRQS